MRLPLTAPLPGSPAAPAPTPTLAPTSATPPPLAPPLDSARASAAVAARVNAEWQRWRQLAVPAAWGVELGRGGTLDGVVHLVGVDRGVPMAEADRRLAHLVALAATDQRAARVVLQRLVAPLVAVARRRARLGHPINDVFDDLLAQAWIAICTYPIDRRPAKIAVNLVRDVEYHTFTRPARLRSAREVPSSDRPLEPPPASHPGSPWQSPAAEAVDVLHAARIEGMSAGTVDLLRRVHLDGASPEAIAAELGVTDRTVRNWRRAAYRELAGVA